MPRSKRSRARRALQPRKRKTDGTLVVTTQVAAPTSISLHATFIKATETAFIVNGQATFMTQLIRIVVEYICSDNTFTVGKHVDVCLPYDVFDKDLLADAEEEEAAEKSTLITSDVKGRWMMAQVDSISTLLVICVSLYRDELWKNYCINEGDGRHRQYIPVHCAPDLLASLATHIHRPMYNPYQAIGCFEADTLVGMANGSFHTICSIKSGDDVRTVDEVSGVWDVAKVIRVASRTTRCDSSKSKIREMVNYVGIWMTPGHPVYLWNKSSWYRADAIAPASPRSIDSVYGLQLSKQHTIMVCGDNNIHVLVATAGNKVFK